MNYIERYWRDARLEDAIKQPPMVARFKCGSGEWIEKISTLIGSDRIDLVSGSRLFWYGVGIGCCEHCQVYDAPDPGEGWRLVDVDKELKQEGD